MSKFADFSFIRQCELLCLSYHTFAAIATPIVSLLDPHFFAPSASDWATGIAIEFMSSNVNGILMITAICRCR